MIDDEKCRAVAPQALLIVKAPLFKKWVGIFSAVTKPEQPSALQGLNLHGLTEGETELWPFHQRFLERLFQPMIYPYGAAEKNHYHLLVKPIPEAFDCIFKRDDQLWYTYYTLPGTKKKIKVQHLLLTGSLKPLAMQVHIVGTFKSSPNAAPSEHKVTITTDAAFAKLVWKCFHP